MIALVFLAIGGGAVLVLWAMSEWFGWRWPLRRITPRPFPLPIPLPPATKRAIRRDRQRGLLKLPASRAGDEPIEVAFVDPEGRP